MGNSKYGCRRQVVPFELHAQTMPKSILKLATQQRELHQAWAHEIV